MTENSVAILFAREDSIYKTLPGCDVYDIYRDAKTFPGGLPVVAHPPCRSWSKLRAFAKPRPGEKELAPWAVEQVRRWGAFWSTHFRLPCGRTASSPLRASETSTAAGHWSSTRTGSATKPRSGRSSTSSA